MSSLAAGGGGPSLMQRMRVNRSVCLKPLLCVNFALFYFTNLVKICSFGGLVKQNLFLF